MRPWPMNVDAGLWYTLERSEISRSSSLSRGRDTVVRGIEIGGAGARTTARAASPSALERRRQ